MLILHFMLIAFALLLFLLAAFGLPGMPEMRRWQFMAAGLFAWLLSTVVPYATR